MGVEKAATFVEIPHHWNVQTGIWLRHYVYDRTTPKGKKPGFTNILITQVVSGVWHGLYAGYWLFFVSSAVFLQGSKSMFRWQRANWPRRWIAIIDFPHWLLTTVGLNYLCGFHVGHLRAVHGGVGQRVLHPALDRAVHARLWRSVQGEEEEAAR
jgi:lysophospholipid acyltransferase